MLGNADTDAYTARAFPPDRFEASLYSGLLCEFVVVPTCPQNLLGHRGDLLKFGERFNALLKADQPDPKQDQPRSKG